MKIPSLMTLTTLIVTIVCSGFPAESPQAEKSEGSVVRADAALDRPLPGSDRLFAQSRKVLQLAPAFRLVARANLAEL